jgi:hypothetical protein
MKKKFGAAKEQNTSGAIGFQLGAVTREETAFRKLMIEARSEFSSRYIAALPKEKKDNTSTEALQEDAAYEFSVRLMDAMSTFKQLIVRRLGQEGADRFVNSVIAWHAAIKSGIGNGGADIVISLFDFPDRVSAEGKGFALGSLKSQFQSIISNTHPSFQVERLNVPSCPENMATAGRKPAPG